MLGSHRISFPPSSVVDLNKFLIQYDGSFMGRGFRKATNNK
jgi:hypothetical protein